MEQLSFSVKEASQMTGIGLTKLYQLINAGTLKARKLGKRTYILKDDLEDFLASLQNYSSRK
jgi:excisionase family DNA binding protein